MRLAQAGANVGLYPQAKPGRLGGSSGIAGVRGDEATADVCHSPSRSDRHTGAHDLSILSNTRAIMHQPIIQAFLFLDSLGNVNQLWTIFQNMITGKKSFASTPNIEERCYTLTRPPLVSHPDTRYVDSVIRHTRASLCLSPRTPATRPRTGSRRAAPQPRHSPTRTGRHKTRLQTQTVAHRRGVPVAPRA